MTGKYERWKHVIDYAVRNLTTMDEEETRLYESDEAMNDYLEGFKREGVHREVIDLIRSALKELRKGYEHGYRSWEVQLAMCGAICSALEPYMSHQNLYHKDYAAWEDAFFKAWDARKRKQ